MLTVHGSRRRPRPGPPLPPGFEGVVEGLRARYRSPGEQRAALAVVRDFLDVYRAAGDETPQGCADAFDALVAAHRWGPRYRERLRAYVSHALLGVSPAMAYAVSPTLRIRAASDRIEGARSQVREFLLVECFPRRWRTAAAAGTVGFRLLTRVGRRFVDELRSASRGNLRRVLALVDRCVLRREPPTPAWAAMPWTAPTAGVEDWWAAMRAVTALGWLRRYGEVYPTAADDGQQPRLGMGLFRAHVRTLSVLHGRILGGDAPRIPVPLRGGRLPPVGEGGAEGGTTTTDDEDPPLATASGRAATGRRLRGELHALRQRLVRPIHEWPDPEERDYAFRPEEVHRLLDACVDTLERVVVWLFLATGLRIGGLCRLELPGGGAVAAARDVPRQLVTTEKNGHRRVVTIGPAGRILIARWCREGRRPPSSPYLFPSGGAGGAAAPGPASRQWVWGVCRRVFRRADLAGAPHAHPHTFRHTFIQYLFLTGSTFDAIAKFIGHASPAITSAVYGRLRHADLQSTVSNMPWLAGADDQRTDVRAAWVGVGRRLQRPWPFAAHEYDGMALPPAEEAMTAAATATEDIRARVRADKAWHEAATTRHRGMPAG